METLGLLGRKLGMMQIFAENGDRIPVTVLEAGPCPIVAVRTHEHHGYQALQLGYDGVPRRTNKARAGYLKKRSVAPTAWLREIRTPVAGYSPGQTLTVSMFTLGERVDVTGVSKGKGFAGGMKRWGWVGGPATHGAMSHRRIGSAGSTTTPGRVLRGKHLPGHLGVERVTVKKLKVVRVDENRNLLFVEGAVPGTRNSLVLVRKRS